MTVSVCLLVPGLAADFSGFAADAFAEASALSRWLSRARRQRFHASGYEQAVLALFDVPFSTDVQPLAPFGFLADSGRAPDAYCLCATPVHLRTDSRGLVLFDPSTFPLSNAESRAMAESVADLLSEDGWQLDSTGPGRWYLMSQQTQALTTAPISSVRGRTVSDFLPRGADARAWMNRINEIQMLLHAHPVNQQRAAEGLPVINSLWIWGGGVLPAGRPARFGRVFTDDVFVRGLGVWAQASCEPVPDSPRQLLEEARDGDRILLVLDACVQAAAYESFREWNDAISSYEHNWFADLLAALRGGRIHCLELIPVNGFRYSVRPHDLWRLWRRVKSYRQIFGADVSR